MWLLSSSIGSALPGLNVRFQRAAALKDDSGKHSRQSRLTHAQRHQQCRTIAGCNLRQKQLQQGQHLKSAANSGRPPGRSKCAGRLRLTVKRGDHQ